MFFSNTKLNELFIKYIFSSRKKLYRRLYKLENKYKIGIHTITGEFLFLKCKGYISLSIGGYGKNENSSEYMLISFTGTNGKNYDIDFEITNGKNFHILDNSNIEKLEYSFLNILSKTKIGK